MTMIPVQGALASAAGAPRSQIAGSETERVPAESMARQRGEDANLHAEQAAGIGKTEEDQGIYERDADGRRLWERPEQNGKNSSGESPESSGEVAAPRKSKDPLGQTGNNLDLTG